MEKEYEKSEWELINPKNISFGLNNHDGLIWEILVGINLRGMPIGNIVQGNEYSSLSFQTNPNDEEYIYRMIMSGRNVMFFRRKRKDE